MKNRKFTYTKRDPEVVKKRSNQRGGDFDSIFKEGVKLYKVKDGKNLIRILPPTWPDADHYGYDAFINYGIGPDENAYLSLSKMKKEKDPLAEAKKQAERDGEATLAKSLDPSKRVLLYVIDRLDEKEGPQLWSAPWTVDKAFCALSLDEDTGDMVMVDDPEMGCDIRFYKEGTGLTTKYPAEKMKILKPSKLSEDEDLQDAWLDHISKNPIPSVLNFYDYDHIASVFDGHVAKETPKKDEDKPSESKPKANAVVRHQITDDDDESKDDDDETEGLEEKSPFKEETSKMTASSMTADSIRARLANRKRVQDDD